MIAILKPHARQFIFTKTQSSRAKDPLDLQNLVVGSYAEPSISAAIQFARIQAPPHTTILVCGSLYLIGEVRAMLE
jgi:folylpolyglutamate synthase/dihydropteroate synthase